MTDIPGPTGEAHRDENHCMHREDDERREEPVEARGPDQLTVMVSARFSRSEADRLGAAAATAGMSRSAFVRHAVLSATTGRALDVARARREVDAAERRLAPAREALG